MIYFINDHDHWILWPVIAIGFTDKLGFKDEFWIGIGWLNFEMGWRSGKEKT